jgi:sugar (glycoside-pentoside-hexuronide) transporter
VSDRLSLAERASYGFGDFGYSLAYNMAGAFLLYYYTTVVGLPAAAVGTIFLVARLLDALIDPLVGIAVDKTRSRWGRTRPYFLFTAVPYVTIFIATFKVPHWSESAQLVYAFLTFKALGIVMSLGSIPYTALMPMMTANPADRLRLGGWRSIGTSVGVILGTAATMPLVGALGGSSEARGFFGVTLLFGALSLFALAMLFRNCRERIADEAPASAFRVLPAVGQMLRNRAWAVCFGFCLLYFVRFGAMLGLTIFYAKDVVQKPWLIPVMLPMVSGGLLIAAFIAPPILVRTGIRRGCIGAILLALVLLALMAGLDHAADLRLGAIAVPPLLLPYLAFSIVTSVTITGIFSMAAATADFHQALFGVRHEGLLSSGISTSTKVGMAVGSALGAFVLSWAGYAPDAVTETARADIRSAYFLIAGALLAAQALVVWFWPMDGAWRARLAAIGA